MKDFDKQLREALANVKGAYDDFISVASEFRGRPDKQQELLRFLKDNPGIGTGKVLEQIIDVILPEIVEDQDYDDE